jgi:hypothetical protein
MPQPALIVSTQEVVDTSVNSRLKHPGLYIGIHTRHVLRLSNATWRTQFPRLCPVLHISNSLPSAVLYKTTCSMAGGCLMQPFSGLSFSPILDLATAIRYLVLAGNLHGVECVLLGHLRLDILDNLAEVGGVLQRRLVLCSAVSGISGWVGIDVPPRAWSTPPWEEACAGCSTGSRDGCGRHARKTPCSKDA